MSSVNTTSSFTSTSTSASTDGLATVKLATEITEAAGCASVGKEDDPNTTTTKTDAGTSSSSETTDATGKVEATPLCWSDQQLFEDALGTDILNKLLATFDPSGGELKAHRPVKSLPVPNGATRYEIHRAVERTWGDRLMHNTDSRTNCMWFKKDGTYLTKWQLQERKQQQKSGKKPFNNNTNRSRNQKPRDEKPKSTGAANKAPPAERTVNAAWGAFAEEKKVQDAKLKAETYDDYKERSKTFNELLKEQKASTLEITFKEKFVQTCKDTTTNGDLGVSCTGDGATAAPRPSGVPPHLRKKTSVSKDVVESD